jgi:hypothetical protein
LRVGAVERSQPALRLDDGQSGPITVEGFPFPLGGDLVLGVGKQERVGYVVDDSWSEHPM